MLKKLGYKHLLLDERRNLLNPFVPPQIYRVKAENEETIFSKVGEKKKLSE